MELIYLWINKVDGNTLNGKEVTFTDEYSVKMINKSENELELNIKKNDNYYNIFKNQVIENVSAIVGCNGSGKTTLLNYIMNSSWIGFKKQNYETGYEQYTKERYENGKTIQIFKNNDKLIIVHNLDKEVYSNYSETKVNRITSESYKNGAALDYEKFTRVYLTNSNYVRDDGYSSNMGSANTICLTIPTLKTLSKKYYENMVGLGNNDYKYSRIQKIIIKERNEMTFQSICDVLYFYYLNSKGLLNKYDGKVSYEFNLSVNSYISILTNEMNDKIKQNLDEDDIKYWEGINKKLETKFSFIGNDIVIDTLKKNLLYELYVIHDIDINKYLTLDLSTLFTDIENEVKDKSEKEYYKNAIEEINEFEQIVSEFDYIENSLPKSDMAYKIYLNVSIKKGKEKYVEFLSFINKKAHTKHSFILKYLNINNLKMSSGERAYLNMFSWLSLLSFFNMIDSSIQNSTKDNILLLIDEIDLYLHPEWQRKIMNFLLSQLTMQFKRKKIQVIFATHSPIILSDIPKSNIVYLNKLNEKTIIDERNVHKESFAANIFNLFNDSFFLDVKGAVGEFAINEVNNVYKDLRDIIEGRNNGSANTKEQKKKIEFIINNIGEPLIKHKLEKMKIQAFPEDNASVIENQKELIEQLRRNISNKSDLNTLENLYKQLSTITTDIGRLIHKSGDYND